MKTEKEWRQLIRKAIESNLMWTPDVLLKSDVDDTEDEIYNLMQMYAEENPVEAEPDTSVYEGMIDLD
jgi:hypothetical protein